jgi:hypothetical protein
MAAPIALQRGGLASLDPGIAALVPSGIASLGADILADFSASGDEGIFPDRLAPGIRPNMNLS